MPEATVVIVSKNRCADLRRAIASALGQDADVELVVIDDGSTDGTADMVRSEFPVVKFVSEVESRGYIVQRNRAAELATAPIIVSIDDDAEFSATDVVRQAIADFTSERI